MSIDELIEWLLSRVRDPRQLIAYGWFAWWLWSLLRRNAQRRAPEAEEPAQAEAEAPTRSPRAPGPQPPPPPARRPPEPPRPPAPAERTPAASRPHPRARLEPNAQRVERARAPDEGRLARALERAHALRKQVGGDRKLRRLEPIVVQEIIDPLRPPADEARAGRAVATLGVLERALREREREPDATRLAEADAVIDACHAPLRRYAEAEDIALRGRHALAVQVPRPRAGSAPEWSDALLLVPVPPGFGAQLEDYPAALHQLGRSWFAAVPGLAEELYAELDLAPRVRLLEAQSSYHPAQLQAYFGPLLPSLFADIALTLRLGSAYVAGLRAGAAHEPHATRARAEGALLSGLPPALLRLRAALHALHALSEHDEAERHAMAFTAEHDGLERSYLPLAGGRFVVVDSSYLLELVDRVAQVVLHAPLASLGGVALAKVPGFAQSLEERRDQRVLSQALARAERPQRADPAQLLCGALRAGDASVDPQTALERLQGALSPRPPREPARRGGPPARAPGSLRAALHDRAALRAAIAIGAAFERPRSLR